MKSLTRSFGALALLSVTAGIMLASAAPSIAEEPSCKAVVIGIGLVCPDKKAPQPTQSVAPVPKQTATADQVQRATDKPSPKEVMIAPEPAATEAPQGEPVQAITEPAVQPAPAPETVAPAVTSAPAVTEVAPSLPSSPPTMGIALSESAEQASASGTSPDFMKQAGEASPYIFFASLAVLIAMIITAKVKKLFPFEGGDQAKHSL